MKTILVVLALILSGCSTNQCNIAQKSLAVAEINYREAEKAGATKDIEKHHWILTAAQASVALICGGEDVESDPR